jgi:hypothetical protein
MFPIIRPQRQHRQHQQLRVQQRYHKNPPPTPASSLSQKSSSRKWPSTSPSLSSSRSPWSHSSSVRFPYYHILPPPHPTAPRACAKTWSLFAGIYVVLFASSLKVLLNKRKTNPGTTPLLALAGVFGALITWVSISRPLLIHSRKTSLTGPPFPPPSALCLTACPHGCRPNSLRFQARPGSPRPRPLLRQRRFCVERNQDFPVPSHHDPLRCVHREFMFPVSCAHSSVADPCVSFTDATSYGTATVS